MQQRKRRKWIAAGAALLAWSSCAEVCRACSADGWVVIGGLAVLLAPSEVGAAASTSELSTGRFVLGWSWQFPVAYDPLSHHRIVPSVDLLPHAGGASWRGRIGYRYSARHLFGGVGVGADGAGFNLSPEIGVRLAHLDDENEEGIDPSLHLLARAEVAPDTGHLRGGTVLLGWNFY